MKCSRVLCCTSKVHSSVVDAGEAGDKRSCIGWSTECLSQVATEDSDVQCSILYCGANCAVQRSTVQHSAVQCSALPPGQGVYTSSRGGQQASKIRSLTNKVVRSPLQPLPVSLAAGLNRGLYTCDRGAS